MISGIFKGSTIHTSKDFKKKKIELFDTIFGFIIVILNLVHPYFTIQKYEEFQAHKLLNGKECKILLLKLHLQYVHNNCNLSNLQNYCLL